MTFMVRAGRGYPYLIIGDVATCCVDTAVLLKQQKPNDLRRHWRRIGDKTAEKLHPDYSLVPAAWYSASRSKTRRMAQLAVLRLTNNKLQFVVFSEDATLLNATGCEIMRY